MTTVMIMVTNTTTMRITIMATIITITITGISTTTTISTMARPGATPTVRSRRNWPGSGGWRRGFAAIVAVGLRPCSGAIIVLVFALAQGLFWAGVAATFVMGLGTAITVAAIATLAVGARSMAKHIASSRSGYGMLALRGIEVGAAVVVLAFGTLLLAGYLVAERGACF